MVLVYTFSRAFVPEFGAIKALVLNLRPMPPNETDSFPDPSPKRKSRIEGQFGCFGRFLPPRSVVPA